MRFRWIAGIVAFAVAAAGPALTYTVTSTADSGAGSLRQAILDANANPGPDAIAFNIPGGGVHTIDPASDLPTISGPVLIDGYTQPGASPNTRPVGQGLDTVLRIEIDGTGLFACLTVAASDTTIRGLVLNRSAAGIQLANGAFTNNKVEGNFIGTDSSGTQRLTQGFSNDVHVTGQSNATIGGTTPAARNLFSGCANAVNLDGSPSGHVIAGNLIGLQASGDALLVPACNATSFAIVVAAGTGVLVGGTTAGSPNVVAMHNGISLAGSGNTAQGNRIGTDVTGTQAFVTSGYGIALSGTNHTVGGGGAGAGNLVAGNGTGILVTGGSGHVIRGNSIGTDSSGSLELGNTSIGINIQAASDVTIGGLGAGEANVIAFNGGGPYSAGIWITQFSGNRIRGNRIFANRSGGSSGGLGINLASFVGEDGVTPNDAGDGDGGANGLQNYPILSSAGPAGPQGAGTRIVGVLNSAASTIFDVDFYSNPACATRPQEFLEGQDYIGSTQVTTDGSGNAAFDVTLPVDVELGTRISATATDPSGNTSEFSQRLIFSMSPAAGPPAGGTNVTLTGMLFENGATVSIGGQPATNVNVPGSTQITATTPALPAGSLNNVVVTNPSGTGGTLVNGWVADFSDVPSSQQFYFHITKLVANAITAGCGTGIYCPLNSVTRQQMAVFLLKSKNGLCYVPPPCTGVFPDVPCSSGFAPWIEALAAAGITGGCGGGNYCPTNVVTRQQMAVFLLKTKHGSSYVPPACDGDFADVSCPSQFADWIEQLAAEGITGGCGGGNYCPTQAVRRDQMAAFLFNTFQFP